jgi:hypothetical protein
MTREEDFSHRDDSFDKPTQVEPHPLSEETLTSTETPDISPEETAILPAELLIAPAEPLSLPPINLAAEAQILPAPPRRRSSPLLKAGFIALLVLMLLGVGTGAYVQARPRIPGSSASISITPDNQQLSKTYAANVTLGSTNPTLNPIGMHTMSMTTPAKSLTVPTTGSQQVPATYATGVLRLADANASKPIPVGSYAIRSNSGVDIEFYISSPISTTARPDVSARAMNPGPSGNIRKADVAAMYDFPNNASIIIANYQPFSGGRNRYIVTAVSQNDINSATSQLTQQLQSGLSANHAALKSQLVSSEQLLDPTTIKCQSSVKANRRPNDQASDVTVTGTMTCSASAYTPMKLQAYGAALLEKDAYAQWNGSYVLSGQIREKLYNVFATGKTVSFDLDVQGLYALKVSPDMSARFATLVAGKTQADAQAILLKQPGVLKVSLQVAGGLGTPLPSSPKDIHITIQA